MAGRIVVIGSSNVDFVMKMDHLPAKGESVPNAEFLQVFGGKGANQAVAAARAGGDVSFVTCVGDDPYAETMVAGYAESGVRTDAIIRESQVASGTALIMIGEGGHNYLAVAPGANNRLTPDRVDERQDLIREAAFVLMQFEIPGETVEHVLTTCRRFGVPVIWNIAPAKPFDARRFRDVSILVANEPEASAVAGIEVVDAASAGRAAERIRELGAGIVIVTLGEAGSVVASGDGHLNVPAYRVTPVDTTAAGDTYCGCLAVALAEELPLGQAVRFASAGAALSVQKMGAQPSTPWRREIEAFMAERKG